MKKMIGLMVLASVIAVIMGYGQGWAQARKQIMPAKVGVVNVDRILKNSRKHAQWQERMNAEEAKIRAELDKMDKDAEAIRADMQTREQGSADYMKLMSSYMDKRAAADARNKYYEQEMTAKVQRWTENLYQDIRAITARVAGTRGIDIVLATEELTFPSASVRDLLLSIKTNKVLYQHNDLDITEEVLAQLDAAR